MRVIGNLGHTDKAGPGHHKLSECADHCRRHRKCTPARMLPAVATRVRHALPVSHVLVGKRLLPRRRAPTTACPPRAAREAAPPIAGVRTGDWRCPCGEPNYATRIH